MSMLSKKSESIKEIKNSIKFFKRQITEAEHKIEHHNEQAMRYIETKEKYEQGLMEFEYIMHILESEIEDEDETLELEETYEIEGDSE